MTSSLKAGFIGGGNMASALIGGIANTLTPGSNIHVIDPKPEALSRLASRFGTTGATAADSRLKACDIIVLAVKPQQIRQAVDSILPWLRQPLILSVAAGIGTADLSRWMNGYASIVRTMPNTPALIGKGITGLFATPSVTEAQKKTAQTILQAVGETVWVKEESLLDTVTAISGSGPAYVFYFIEALKEAGEKLGLEPAQAEKLAIATFCGASELARQSDEPVPVLRERVTSPGGTTFAALTVMEENRLKSHIIAAAEAAAKRSVELGESFGKTA
ncbi:MAG: pyrroline-5-carboxylate reductase [Alistipes senegalensis]|nr:pyrroline-5-carboxylate reductase [Oxalobacter formigenes]MCM1280378.1 pyrroline-5-carboxylate reductase [Alistipes senegalensis]